jgi:arylsulfatase A-like enzyme
MTFWLHLFLLGTCLTLGAAPRPNIIVILTDDQGYGDLSAHGNPVLRTPHLDALYAQSVRFSDFMVSPTCSPTRAALLTGKHEFRSGVTHTISERERLDFGATTLAKVVQKAGYRTGIFGKWHLGDEDAYLPNQRGFDEVFIHGAGGIGQSYPGSCGDAPGNTYFDPTIWHRDRFVKTAGYCTDVFFRQARTWISESARAAQPFFCWIATNAPHSPYNARPEDRARYAGKGLTEAEENFFGMIHNIDENVGALIAQLDASGLSQNTLVIFLSDNGGTAGTKVYNAGMRGSKLSPWHGGTRALSLWRWPATYQPATCEAFTAHLDVFPTLAGLAGATLPPDLEGRDLRPLLENPRAPWPTRTLFTHGGRWERGTSPDHDRYRWCAARDERYTLVIEKRAPPDQPPPWQLYDLKSDPAQATNIAAENPAIVARLGAAYEAWWKSVQPSLTNENAPLAPANPFKERYEKQFGRTP